MFFDENTTTGTGTGTCACIVFSTCAIMTAAFGIGIGGTVSKGSLGSCYVVVVAVPAIAAEESIAKDCPPCFCPF